MKFSIASGIALLAATAAALPQPKDIADDIQNGNGIGNKGNSQVRFPVPDDLTVEQASAKCGDKAQLSCCNKATYTGDSTKVNDGLLSGALSELLGAGSGSEGLGLFNQCSKLPLQSMFPLPVSILSPQTLINISPRHRYWSAGRAQPEVQAEHRLLPGLARRRLGESGRPRPALRCPRLHPLNAFNMIPTAGLVPSWAIGRWLLVNCVLLHSCTAWHARCGTLGK